jgi:SAM-dependent methyltransferase
MMTPTEIARAEEIRSSGVFRVEDIPMMTRVFESNLLRPSSDARYFARTSMEPPAWYDRTLAPDSAAYTQQQLRLWRLVSGRDRDYRPEVDEKEADVETDPVRLPGFYANRAVGCIVHASDEMIATAQILRHCNLHPGGRALEYGAGFGQTALALSRLGVKVDTVDISRQLCRYVKANADFFRTSLTPHVGQFGDNPLGTKFDLIYFQEAFHHAIDFRGVLEKVKSNLAPGGRLLLCGEPVSAAENELWAPYPWGVRIDGQTVPLIRSRGWMKLGFTHAYLMSVLKRAGFRTEYFPSPQTPRAHVYVCEHSRSEDVADFPAMATQTAEAATWHEADAEGRWSKDRSVLRFATKKQTLAISAVNYLPVPKTLTVENGGREAHFEFEAGESKVVTIPNNGDTIVLSCEAHSPVTLSKGEIADDRSLGLFVKSVFSY